MSIVCEQFGCLPSQALREITEDDPSGLLWAVLDCRGYRQARDDVQRSRDDEDYDLELSEMTALVEEIEAEIQAERRARYGKPK